MFVVLYWVVVLLLGVTLFDGDPYTPNDVKEMVEERFSAYNPRLVLQSSRVVSTKPNKHNEYTFLDENNGFVFTTSVYVKTPELPIPGGQRVTRLSIGMQIHI